MAATTKLEFFVQMTCEKCEQDIAKVLNQLEGVSDVVIDRQSETVLMKTSLPSQAVKELIESTGRRAVIKGVGSTGANLGSAVAIMSEGEPAHGVQGVVRLAQIEDVTGAGETCVIEGTLDGLTPLARHTLAIHQYGDLSAGCSSCGEILGMHEASSTAGPTPYGCLGEVVADESGRASFRFMTARLSVLDTIGRSMLLQGPAVNLSNATGPYQPSAPLRLACGVIARSAGLFENSKRICSCDGVTLWDERDRPVAGSGRKQSAASHL